ncbi:MAG: SPFH domain-containing protein [Cyanobacteria bacterium]|nr:SPFH domain-containing protein [Cyanobacteriota bacterium]MDA0867440.1 SPFH domain-containing protein [Cyanobacteriota bacterium]
MTQDNKKQDGKLYAEPQKGHVSLGGAVRSALFFTPLLLLAFVFTAFLGGLPPQRRGMPVLGGIAIATLWGVAVNGVRVAAQWERGVVLRLGKFQETRGPGLMYVIPIIEQINFVDTRTLVLNIPRQKVITRDNVPAEIDSALFFQVQDPEKAVISIQDFQFAASQYAQAALRDVIGGLSLDDLLSEREEIQAQIATIVEAQVREWGLHIDAIRLQDIELPEDLKRMMSRQASAEREKRATITKAEGDRMAAESLAQAATIMENSPITLELRALQTIDSLGAGPSNTVILFPVELLSAVESLRSQQKS